MQHAEVILGLVPGGDGTQRLPRLSAKDGLFSSSSPAK
jgi:enoyl-CoA hydratase/carnithine racemase